MKLPFKSIEVSTIVHATESKKKLKKTLRLLIPEEVEIEESEAEGHYGDSKLLFSARIENRSEIRKFWDNILEHLVEKEKDWLKNNAIDRIADDCKLYLRFDKQLAVAEEMLRFSDSGDVVHVRINIAAYPAKKDLAVEEMEKFLKSGLHYE